MQVRREIYDRDGGRCTFVDADRRRCTETARLEIDHIVPWALGGPSTVDNSRLLCPGHNAHVARQTFGDDFINQRIERRTNQRRSLE